MKLPNGDRAIVTDEKLHECLVNVDHPVQPGHAELFERLLGISQHNAEDLRTALLHAASTSDAQPGAPSAYGANSR